VSLDELEEVVAVLEALTRLAVVVVLLVVVVVVVVVDAVGCSCSREASAKASKALLPG